jgi:hypothetical protein
LRELTPDLRAAGIEVDFEREPRTKSRVIRLRNVTADVVNDTADITPSSASLPHSDNSNAALVPFQRLSVSDSDVAEDDKDEDDATRDYTWYVLGALAALVGAVVLATSRR